MFELQAPTKEQFAKYTAKINDPNATGTVEPPTTSLSSKAAPWLNATGLAAMCVALIGAPILAMSLAVVTKDPWVAAPFALLSLGALVTHDAVMLGLRRQSRLPVRSRDEFATLLNGDEAKLGNRLKKAFQSEWSQNKGRSLIMAGFISWVMVFGSGELIHEIKKFDSREAGQQRLAAEPRAMSPSAGVVR